MIKIEFTSEEIDNLHYERFHYPSPRVQLKMEALYLKSQGLPHGTIQSLCKISSVTLAEYLRQYIAGGINRLKLNLHKGKSSAALASPSRRFLTMPAIKPANASGNLPQK